MGDILDASGHKIATIGQDWIVYNTMMVNLGHVQDNGDVYDNMGTKIGGYDGKGYVYEAGKHIGTVHSDGKVYDYENDLIGSVIGNHIQSGGAALLLLVR